jgi:asparagine synthetase B (glutamine-hydrolysing)
MCGIAAILGEAPEPAVLAALLAVSARRGPEATRTWSRPGLMLVHAALRFVDVHDNDQPLTEADGSALIWNGEIYNWRELAARYGLGARNDTQTLLRGLQLQGAAFLTEIEGQFAFVAQRGGRTLVGRDKWGICPLVFGRLPAGGVAIASTSEALRVLGVLDVKTVPAGMTGEVAAEELRLTPYFRVPRVAPEAQKPADPGEVLALVTARVHSRIPDDPGELFTTMGGIDSQSVTACVARALGGRYGGAVTIVPWQPDGAAAWGGDYPYVTQTLAQLAAEGCAVTHHVAVLTPEFIEQNLDRLLRLLGPDMFNLICGLSEDLVAATVAAHGGRVIMTAGGPDEAGRSYDRWTLAHVDQDRELAWLRLCEQFSSSEGVRAGLVFGDRGLENRVPLADLIELAAHVVPEHKQRIHDPGDGLHVSTLRVEHKIFWRRALQGLLPDACLAAKKEPIFRSTGALHALFDVLGRDREYQYWRGQFAHYAFYLGWNAIVFSDLRTLDPSDRIAECQLYALYRWNKLEPELFARGGPARYGAYEEWVPRCEDEPAQRVHKPLCYDWQLGRGVPLRPVL